MTLLNNSVSGRLALRDAIGHYMNRRLGRHWARSAFRALTEYAYNWFDGHATLGDLTASLNSAFDAEIFNCRMWAARYGMTKESFKNEEYYVDPLNGSDTDGDGSAAAPYASLWFLPYFLPKTIRHQYTIIIMNDITLDDFELNAHFEGIGSISIVGGKPYEVVSTGFEISAVNDYYSEFGMPVCTGIEVDPVVLAPDQHWSTWIRFTSGVDIEHVTPVHQNTTNEFIYGNISSNSMLLPEIGDTFDLIRPSVSLSCKSFRVRVTQDSDCGWSGQIDPQKSVPLRFQLANLEIDTSGSTALDSQFDLVIDGSFNISFVRLHKQQYPMVSIRGGVLRRSECNWSQLRDEARLITMMGYDATTNIRFILRDPGFYITQQDKLWPNSPDDSIQDIRLFDHNYRAIDSRGRIVIEYQRSGNCSVACCRAAAFNIDGGANAQVFWSFADGCADGYGYYFQDTHCWASMVYCRAGIDMFWSARCQLRLAYCVAAGGGETPELTGVGLRVIGMTHVDCDELLDLVGIVGGIAWATDGVPTIDTWPLLNNTKYDTVGGAGAVPMGSWVTRPV